MLVKIDNRLEVNHMLQAAESVGMENVKCGNVQWSVQNGIIMSIFYLCITIMSAVSDTIGVPLFMFALSSRRFFYSLQSLSVSCFLLG
jgi:hypothetical protein